MSAFKIFNRFAELIDINVPRAAAAWLRLNADGTVTERTVADTLTDLGVSTRTKASATARTTTVDTLDPDLNGDELKANTTYEVDFYLPITADAAVGIKFNFEVPSKLINTGYFGVLVRENGGLQAITGSATSTVISVRDTTAACTTGLYGHFRFCTGATGGNFGLKWACNAAAAGMTTLLAGACYTITKR